MKFSFSQLSLTLIFISTYSYAFNMISFNGKVARWHQSVINYVIDSRGSDDFNDGCDGSGECVTERQAINKAFAAWSNVPNVNLSFNEQPTRVIKKTGADGVNTIKWIEKNWTSYSFAQSNAAIAVTVQGFKTSNNEMFDMDIFANGQFKWAVIDSNEERNNSNVMDIQNIFTHEIGHGIGIGHSSVDSLENSPDHYLATMFYSSGPGETFRRDLKELDVAAVQHSYSSVDLPKPNVESVSKKEFNLTNQHAYQIRLDGSQFINTTSVFLKVGSYNDDVQAKIISRDEESMLVEFDFSGVPSGSFDLIVANSTKEEDITILKSAITIASPYAAAQEFSNTDEPSEGKTALTSCQSGSPQAFLFLFILILSTFHRSYHLKENVLRT